MSALWVVALLGLGILLAWTWLLGLTWVGNRWSARQLRRRVERELPRGRRAP